MFSHCQASHVRPGNATQHYMSARFVIAAMAPGADFPDPSRGDRGGRDGPGGGGGRGRRGPRLRAQDIGCQAYEALFRVDVMLCPRDNNRTLRHEVIGECRGRKELKLTTGNMKQSSAPTRRFPRLITGVFQTHPRATSSPIARVEGRCRTPYQPRTCGARGQISREYENFGTSKSNTTFQQDS